MCRLLIVKSQRPSDHSHILSEFADMCEASRSPEGDWQGDGCGIAYAAGGGWRLEKSLKPIWEQRKMCSHIPETRLLVAHARSSGFADQKGVLEYNQPYVSGDECFVFNGMIRGVKIGRTLEGKIGAQKIFSFLQQELRYSKPEQALRTVHRAILGHSAYVQAMNIGFVSASSIYVLCEYSEHIEYFTLRYYQDEDLTLLCSQPLRSYAWKKMGKGEIKTFSQDNPY